MSWPKEQHSSHYIRRPKRPDVDKGRELMGTCFEDDDSVKRQVREAIEARAGCEDDVIGLMYLQ